MYHPLGVILRESYTLASNPLSRSDRQPSFEPRPAEPDYPHGHSSASAVGFHAIILLDLQDFVNVPRIPLTTLNAVVKTSLVKSHPKLSATVKTSLVKGRGTALRAVEGFKTH